MSSLTRTVRVLAAAASLCLLATACLGQDSGGSSGGGGGGGAGDGATGSADLSGMTVEIMGAFVEPADDAFREAVAPFEEETGVTVNYEGSGDFETLITTRVTGGNPPDIAMFPQPGLMEDFVERGELQPLDDILDTERLEQELLPGVFDLGTVEGSYYGLPRVLAVKSNVWYPPTAFEEAGYQIPETYDELLTLTETIAEESAEAQAPWCLGIESSGATGWVVTDWIEDLMLRTAGPEAYDQWVAGELNFASPEVTRAAELFAQIALQEGHVRGGRTGIVTTPFGEAMAPMFSEPPGCYLHKQASFIRGFFPEGVQPGEDVDIFYFPPVEGGFEGRPVLSSGDLASLFTDNPAAEALMQYMSESDLQWLGPQVQTGSDFAPFADFPLDEYPDELTRRMAEILINADVVRFDASDSMPGAVGTGAFWREMVAWVNGDQELQQALENIDAAWPE